MNDLVLKICEHFELEPGSVVRKKFRHLPEYLVGEIIERILVSGKPRISEVFPEMSERTASSMLSTVFVSKNGSKQSWKSYLLASISYKNCYICKLMLPADNFSKDGATPDGLSAQCRCCSKQYYQENRSKILEQKKDYYEKNIDTTKEYKKQHYQDNRDKLLAVRKQFYQQNRKDILERSTQYYQDNIDKLQEKQRLYYQDHKTEHIARNVKRKAAKLNATPNWANLEEIRKIYTLCPPGCHVDHIIPLQGRNVCGLHTQHNLQYLTAAENLSKSNKFDTETYIHQTEYTPPYYKQL